MGMQAQAGRKAKKSAALSAALSLPAGAGEPFIIFSMPRRNHDNDLPLAE
jgi:hypothetical protein